MRQKMKTIGLLLLLFVLSLSFSSCENKEEQLQIVKTSKAEPEYIRFFSLESLAGSDVGKYWSELFVENYNRQAYISFDGASYYDEEGLSYRELLVRRLQSSIPDDLYIINAEDVIDFEKKGYWMDLSELDFVDNLSDAALYQSTYHGKVFSVPLVITGFGFYWNVDMLRDHGLTVPENLEEFWKVCETLKEAGILPYGANKGYALTVPAMCKGLADLYESADRQQQIDDLNNGTVLISEYMQEGFEFLSQMLERGYMDAEQALETIPGNEMELFLNEECAFICIGMGSTLSEPEKNSFQVELTGLPVLSDGCISVYGADLRLCVNPKSKHLDTALQFIEMVGTPEALEESARLQNVMSSAKGSNDVAFPTKQKMCELMRQPGQIPNQDFALNFNTWENIRNVAREICGGISIEEACKQLDELQRMEIEDSLSNDL